MLAALVIGGLTACSGGTDREAGASSAAATTPLDLPGDEALTPPPPDPEASDQLSALAALPDGELAGHVRMSVSGLAAFDEPAIGTCSGMAEVPVLEVRLADGSLLRVSFGADRATSVLTAPGVEARHALDDVRMSVDGAALTVEADLLTDGTTENSGALVLTGRCA